MKKLIIGAFILILFLFILIKYCYDKIHLTNLDYQLKMYKQNIDYYNDNIFYNCSIPYPIYYINMDKDVDRRIYMEKELAKISSCPYIFRVKGFNGYKIKNSNHDSVDGVKFNNKYKMTKSEIGCTMSHLLAIKKAYDNNDDIAVIFEDDISFDVCTFNTPIKNIIDSAPKDWELLQLFTFGKSIEGNVKSLNKLYSKDKTYIKYSPTDIFYSTAAYVLNKNGMRKIIEKVYKNGEYNIEPTSKNFPKEGTADVFIYKLIDNAYVINPSIFITNDISLTSTIHPDHELSHREYILENLKNIDQISDKQINFTKTLILMDSILKKFNIKFFLAFGTALGVRRENKFITHDNDIDIGIFFEDYHPSIENEILKKFHLIHRLGSLENNGGYEISVKLPETGVSLDIFLFYKKDNYIWSASYFGLCNKTKNKMCRWKFRPFKLKQVLFLNKFFYIPSDEFLVDQYGDDWHLPKKFSYEEGLEDGYKNLMYDDFPDEMNPEKINGNFKDTKNIVWQYWETSPNKTKPGYISLCMSMLAEQCADEGIEYVELNPSNVHSYLNESDIPSNWHNIKNIAHKADYIRAVILYRYGGLWIDADSIVTRFKGDVLKEYLNFLEKVDWALPADNEGLSIGIMAVRKNSPFLYQWITMMKKIINEKNTFGWTELGYDILNPLWNEWNKKYGKLWKVKLLSYTDTTSPIQWKDSSKFFEKGTSNFLERNIQPVVMLYNNIFPEWFKNLSLNEVINFVNTSDTIIADLFRKNLYMP